MTEGKPVCLSCGVELKTLTKVIGKDVCGQCYGKGAFRPCFICSKAEKDNLKISQVLSTASCRKHFMMTCGSILVLGILATLAGAWYVRAVDGGQKTLLLVGVGLVIDSFISLSKGKKVLHDTQ